MCRVRSCRARASDVPSAACLSGTNVAPLTDREIGSQLSQLTLQILGWPSINWRQGLQLPESVFPALQRSLVTTRHPGSERAMMASAAAEGQARLDMARLFRVGRSGSRQRRCRVRLAGCAVMSGGATSPTRFLVFCMFSCRGFADMKSYAPSLCCRSTAAWQVSRPRISAQTTGATSHQGCCRAIADGEWTSSVTLHSTPPL